MNFVIVTHTKNDNLQEVNNNGLMSFEGSIIRGNGFANRYYNGTNRKAVLAQNSTE